MPQLDHYNFYFSFFLAFLFAFYLLSVLMATVYLPMLLRHKINQRVLSLKR